MSTRLTNKVIKGLEIACMYARAELAAGTLDEGQRGKEMREALRLVISAEEWVTLTQRKRRAAAEGRDR